MKKIILFISTLLFAQTIFSQEDTRVITTAVPFLLVAADARAAGMADNGVATAADAFSQQWNPAKYAFSLEQQGFTMSYTPYLTGLANDISLGQVNYFNRINERNAFAGSFRYFGLGDVQFTNQFGDLLQTVSPNEFALDASYALKLSERFSMAVAGRFISSQLKFPDNNNDASAANTFAVDIAAFYQSEEIAFNDFNGRWRAGINFQNMGPKINYDNDNSDLNSNFIPANMRIGTGFDFILDEYNKIGVNLEFTKLMVPTPQDPDLNGDGTTTDEEISQNNINYNSIGWVQGMFQSFSDAPDGFGEELKEFTYSLGTEYVYQDVFSLRAGYFHESPEKGAREYFSIGAGFKYNVIKIDISYLFSTSNVVNPLENTLRFSLTFNFGDKYDEY
jgi:hypothetical protein